MLENGSSFSKYHKSIVFSPVLLNSQLMLLLKRIKARAQRRVRVGEIKVFKLGLARGIAHVRIQPSLQSGSLKGSAAEKKKNPATAHIRGEDLVLISILEGKTFFNTILSQF